MHERVRDIILAAWGRTVASRPVLTLVVCLALAAVSVVATAMWLEFRTDRSQLIDADKTWNRLYNEYKANYPHYHDVTVVLDGDPADPAIDEIARRLATRLQADERIDMADAGFDAATAGPKFFRLAGRERFDEALHDLARGREVTGAENANAALGMLLKQLREDAQDVGAIDQLERFLAPYLAAVTGGTPSFEFLSPSHPRWQSLQSGQGEGCLRFVRVHLAAGEAGHTVDKLAATLESIRETVAEEVAAGPRPDLAWGVTGIPAIESDETSAAIHDSTLASLLAIALITIVMLVAFRGLTVPALAATALLIGMAWSFGWLMLSVGHLQLLSVVFTVILLGLGIDFALLFVSRLELVQDQHKDLASATSRVYRRMGPGMVTGAVTTAAAFAATALTDFTGMAEMGIIAAGGIVLCLVAVLSAFPALLALTGRWKKVIQHRPGGERAPFARGLLDFVDGRPVPTLIAAGVVVASLVGLSTLVRYDPNVLNLQAAGVESVQWEKRIVDEDARSVWSAVILATPELTPEIADRLRLTSEVSGVGGMATLYPRDLDHQEARIATVRETPVTALGGSEGLTTTIQQLAAVRAGILLRSGDAPPGVRRRLEDIATRINDALGRARTMGATVRADGWLELNDAFTAARDELAEWTAAALTPGPPGPGDLPPFLRDMWVGDDGSWLVLAYPDADPQQRSVLDPDRLGPFVGNVRHAVADLPVAVIGPPVQIYESSELIRREYVKAAVYAVAVILIVLFLDFRNLADALCAMAPVTIGFLGAFGLMGLLRVPLNFANIIILPIIFGIGVNAGVHVVHRWRLEPYGRPRGLSGGTGRGITLTMLTTMIGFGCLLIADHRGIRSLGTVMLLGLSVTLLACYIVLPAILQLRAQAAAHGARKARKRHREPAHRPRRIRTALTHLRRRSA